MGFSTPGTKRNIPLVSCVAAQILYHHDLYYWWPSDHSSSNWTANPSTQIGGKPHWRRTESKIINGEIGITRVCPVFDNKVSDGRHCGSRNIRDGRVPIRFARGWRVEHCPSGRAGVFCIWNAIVHGGFVVILAIIFQHARRNKLVSLHDSGIRNDHNQAALPVPCINRNI